MKTYTIGRNPSANITLTANFCSRDHAKLTISDNGKILLQDTSSNGTTVNGKKITNQTVEVNYGDEVLFAGVEKLDWSKIEKPQPKSIAPSKPNIFVPFINRHAVKLVLASAFIGVLLLALKFIPATTTSSSEKLFTATDIYNQYKTAVALVEVKYYVRIHTTANELYFGIKADSSIGFSKNKTDLQPLTSEGTAFFIDSSGKLVTNHHVITPWLYDKDLKDYFFTKVKPAIKKVLRENGWGNQEPEFFGELESIGIYMNGTRFTPENRIACNPLKVADDKAIDLGTIQVSSETLPAGATIVAASNIETDEKQILVGSSAFVISFPYGDALATNESNEINCTSTQGNFTQTPAKNYVQYSAQIASGSSGSPVFNQHGKLVAVTYEGTPSGQSFNRGILAKYIQSVK